MPSAVVLSRLRSVSLAALVAFGACNVFEPPEATTDGGAGTGATLTGGKGGTDASTGGSGGTGATGGGGAGGSGGNTGGAAGTDAGPGEPWWPYTTPDGCQSAGVPTSSDRPASSDPGSTIAPIYLATSRMRFGSANDDAALTPNDKAWVGIGFDIDQSCTNSPTCTADGA